MTLPLTKLTRYCNVIVIGGGALWGTGGAAGETKVAHPGAAGVNTWRCER